MKKITIIQCTLGWIQLELAIRQSGHGLLHPICKQILVWREGGTRIEYVTTIVLYAGCANFRFSGDEQTTILAILCT